MKLLPRDFLPGESDVCKDLIEHYAIFFKVEPEEIRREEEIVRKTENFSKNPNPVKLSGEAKKPSGIIKTRV